MGVLTADAAPAALPRLRFDRHELAGAVADLGVFIPIAVALIVSNGLSPTAVLLPAGLLYVASGLFYRVPIPVQPLKAFGAIAIAQGLGADVIAAGTLIMGVLFVALGGAGVIDRVARVFPQPLVRGIQLSVGLLFLKLAWGLVTEPPKVFADHGRPPLYLLGGAAVVVALALLLRKRAVTLALLAVGVVIMAVSASGVPGWGPSALHAPVLTPDAFATAAVALVLPQLPLTFANSCLATADAARTYFGGAAARVRPGRLAVSLGLANLVAGAMCGMPVCHGAGGLTAHRSFGARTGGAPVALGAALVAVALTLGAGLSTLLAGFPLPIMAGLLAVAGVLHIALLRDLRRPFDWALAVAVGVAGFATNLAWALLGGLAVWWLAQVVRRLLDARQAKNW